MHSLSLRRDDASLSLFYRYYSGKCSVELNLIPALLNRPRATRQASQAHQYAIALNQSRIELFSNSFIASTSVLCNNLPSEVFPDIYDLTKFKSNVNRYFCFFFTSETLVWVFPASIGVGLFK